MNFITWLFMWHNCSKTRYSSKSTVCALCFYILTSHWYLHLPIIRWTIENNQNIWLAVKKTLNFNSSMMFNTFTWKTIKTLVSESNLCHDDEEVSDSQQRSKALILVSLATIHSKLNTNISIHKLLCTLTYKLDSTKNGRSKSAINNLKCMTIIQNSTSW